MVQAVFWKAWPSQKAPPLSGAGLVQVRVRFCQPRPQRLEQGDQSDQLDQPPFTAGAVGVTWLCGLRDPRTLSSPDRDLLLRPFLMGPHPRRHWAGSLADRAVCHCQHCRGPEGHCLFPAPSCNGKRRSQEDMTLTQGHPVMGDLCLKPATGLFLPYSGHLSYSSASPNKGNSKEQPTGLDSGSILCWVTRLGVRMLTRPCSNPKPRGA